MEASDGAGRQVRGQRPRAGACARPAPDATPLPQVPPLRITALGTLTVLRGDTSRTGQLVRADKAVLLLAALLATPEYQLTRARAITLLWPDEELVNPRGSLREVLARLRGALSGGETADADAYVASRGQQLCLRADTVWLDARVFRQQAEQALASRDQAVCEAALGLYGGDFLPQVPAEGLHDLAALLTARRAALRRSYAEVLAHSAALCAPGDGDRAREQLRRAVALSPGSEHYARRLMDLWAEAGELGRLQEVFGHLCHTLARQGTTPSAETVTLHDRLLAAGLGASAGPTQTAATAIQMLLAVPTRGGLPPALRAVARAYHGTPLAVGADCWCCAFEDPVEAAGAAWTLAAPPRGSAIPAGLPLALHAGRVSGPGSAAPAFACALALLAHPGQVLVSRAAQPLLEPALPPTTTLVPLDRYLVRPEQPPEPLAQLSSLAQPTVFPPLQAPRHRPQNLPAPLTSYLARPQLEARLAALLSPAHAPARRLLTLTGVGGGGKTRLALQVAADLLPFFPEGVWLVECAALHDGRDLPAQVAGALGLRDGRGRPALERVLAFLQRREQPLLLLLDNCEHLRGACAELAATLLRASTQVRILTTSRIPLGMQGERVEEVPVLSTPPCGQQAHGGAIARSEAIRLFHTRATEANPRFTLTAAEAALLARICMRLDGIPLAIELAAAQLQRRPLAAIAAGLERLPALLAGGNAGAEARQRTLRAALDWSYDLLDVPSRTLFRRLAVFAGGCTLAAAQEVCGTEDLPPAQVALLLQVLQDASLVRAYRVGAQQRYRMLEPVRQYALEQLHRGERARSAQPGT